MQSSIILYDFSYKMLLSKCDDFIRDCIEVLKYNKGFEVQHYIVGVYVMNQWHYIYMMNTNNQVYTNTSLKRIYNLSRMYTTSISTVIL